MKTRKDITKEMAHNALNRSNVYGFLAAVYMREMSDTFLSRIQDPRFMGVLIDLGVELGDEFFKSPDKTLIEELAVEYARLFLGPGKHISPHESVHHRRDDGEWGSLWGKSTVEVKNFVESAGLRYNPEFTGMPDHIGVELEFMQALLKDESAAWENNDIERVNYCCKIGKMFMNEHLSKWVGLFCDKVISEAGNSFYGEIAGITKNFIELEKEAFEACSDSSRKKQLNGT